MRLEVYRPFLPGSVLRNMKGLKDVSLFAAMCIAIMAMAIPVSPSMEVSCQGQSPIPSLELSTDLDEPSVPCYSGGAAHAHGCYSHTLASGCGSAIQNGSPALVPAANDHFHMGRTVQPPGEPPRIPA